MKSAVMVDFGRRLSKLRGMSFDEITGRLSYRMVVAAERQQHRAGTLAPGNRLERAIRRDLAMGDWRRRLLYARRSSPARFLPSVYQRREMRTLFETTYASEYTNLLVHAERARNHRFEFFGSEIHYDNDIDWHMDPVTKSRWPVRFHADVPVHGGNVGYGDVKYVWELNRHQYLIDLGKSYFLTGNQDDVRALTDLIRSWQRGNPYATGVNWACALEPAFRVWSWLWAYYLTVDALDDDFHLEWLVGFYDHGRFLASHMEHYGSPYNHLIGEAAALYALGLCFPELDASAEWTRKARHVLESRLEDQFYGDGGSVEQSLFYHHATTGFYILAALLGRANGQAPSRAVWERIQRAIEYSMLMTQPDGRIPAIGGADDGKPIRMEHLPFWDFRPYQAVGAVMFGRPDFKAVAARFYEDGLWLLGVEGLHGFATLEAEPPTVSKAELRDSGYFVDRNEWSPRADYVCFDVGEQATGIRTDAVPNSMHGHADCLSVIAWLQGEPVLVDSGLYAYNAGGAWEAHFRETAAHNTARVDGQDQARHLGKMAWSHGYRARVEGRLADTEQSWTIGSHDGYARGPDGVTHRRAVWLRPGGYFLVYDQFVGPGAHHFEINFQFAPGSLVISGERCARFRDDVQVAWTATGTWNATIRCGGREPSDGWICPSLGVKIPAPRLTLDTASVDPFTSVLTVFASAAAGVPRVTLSSCGAAGQSTILRVAGPGYADWVAAAGVSAGGPIDSDGLLSICGLDPDGGIRHELQAGGTYVRVDAGNLRECEAMLGVTGRSP